MIPLISVGLAAIALGVKTSTSAIRPGASFEEYTTLNFLPPPCPRICDRLGSYVAPMGNSPEAVPAAMASNQMTIGVTYEPSLSQIIGKFMGVSAKEVKEQWAGVYNIPLAEMPKAFLPGKETPSYYASGEVIANLLKAKGQIKALPPAESTFDGSIVKTLTK